MQKEGDMKRIKSRLIGKMGKNRLNALGILSMENILINEKITSGKSNFQENLVQHFTMQKERKMDFYKGKSTSL